MKTLTKHLDGLVTATPTATAECMLKGQPVGTRALITAMNGGEMWVKEESGIRESTLQEWEHYWSQKEKGFE